MNQFEALDPIYFIYVGGLLGLLFFIEGMRHSIYKGGNDAKVKTKRLKMLAKGMSAEDILGTLRRPSSVEWYHRIPVFGTIPAKMQQAGFSMKPAPFLAICFAVCVVIFVLGRASLGFLPALGAAITAGVVIPLNIINIVRRERIEAFAMQLPDALDLMKRGMSVGHPLNVTITNVALNMKDPIATEFGIVADQITYGEELPEAFLDLADRIDQEDMHYLAASIAIQYGTGGNLGTMFGTLSKVIRARFALRRRIKAISSEGRISAYILTALPFLMIGSTMLTAPDYYAGVSHDPKFMVMAVAVGILIAGNALLLRRLVNFKV